MLMDVRGFQPQKVTREEEKWEGYDCGEERCWRASRREMSGPNTQGIGGDNLSHARESEGGGF